jgi:hypothetical protein
MAEIDPLLIDAIGNTPTAVEETSWGRIKAGSLK